jgi:hypothetical protein
VGIDPTVAVIDAVAMVHDDEAVNQELDGTAEEVAEIAAENEEIEELAAV